jgi:hypothetical protein
VPEINQDNLKPIDSTPPVVNNPQPSREPVKVPNKEKRKKIIIISSSIIFALILVALLGVTIYRRYYLGTKIKPPQVTLVKPAKEKNFNAPEEEKVASPINGEMVSPAALKNYPLAVMVENHPDARPQSGLVNASAVYEAITEGGITRFMAIFMQNSAPEIGPVRSARSFFIDWASEYSAYYAHAGGAKDALQNIPTSNVFDLPDTTGYFTRINRNHVATEHTLYTSTQKLYDLAAKKKYPADSHVSSLQYKDDAKIEDRGDKSSVTIDFSTASYKVNWSYDKNSNLYSRTLGGIAHKDRTTGQQITAKVIAVEEVSRENLQLPGAKATFKFQTIGSGKATIYQDGQEITATWKKSNQNDRTKFYDSQNNEITLDRGVIWYEITPPGTPVSTS